MRPWLILISWSVPPPGWVVSARLSVHRQIWAKRFFLYPIEIGLLFCSDLKTADGDRISADCDLCHTIVAQGVPGSMERAQMGSGLDFVHPVDIDGADVFLIDDILDTGRTLSFAVDLLRQRGARR